MINLIRLSLLVVGSFVFAQQTSKLQNPAKPVANELTFVPAPEMPITNILGELAIDLRVLNAGDLISFDIFFENVDFTFAAAEFLIYHPAEILKLSDQDSDWETGQGAVFTIGRDLAGSDLMLLPTDAGGYPTASMVDINQTRVGMVITNPANYWQGTPANPYPGGHIGRISYVYNENLVNSCTSQIEPLHILITPLNQAGYTDYFSDNQGQRRAIVDSGPLGIFGLDGLPAYFGDPSKSIRADGNHDGFRTAADALPAARCAIFGQFDVNCHPVWQSEPVNVFTQTFDFNCSGQVTSADALGLARLTIGLRDRTVTAKNHLMGAEIGVSSAGVLDWVHDERNASMVFLSLEDSDDRRAIPYLNRMAQASGWSLVFERRDHVLDILLVSKTLGPIPEIHFPIETAKTSSSFKLLQAVYLDR